MFELSRSLLLHLMWNQVLTEKTSSMSEQGKMAILTNEMNRRFLMMDEQIEIEEKIERLIISRSSYVNPDMDGIK